MNRKIFENMFKNKKALGIVSLLGPVELMKSLVRDCDLLPKEAAKVVYDLKKKTEEGIAPPSIETNKQFPVPPTSKKDPDHDDEDLEEDGPALGRPQGKVSFHGPATIKRHYFPPDPIEKEKDFPYDDVYVNYMNNPKRKQALVNSKGPVLKKRNPLDVDIRSNEPGGDAGATGIQSRDAHPPGNDMPSSGNSWNTRGPAGWASSPPGKEFHTEPVAIKKRKEEDQRPPNAGDDDDEPKFLKQPEVGSGMWIPGQQPVRQSPYRHWRKR